MADAAPTVLPLSPPDWDPDSAARRIAQLESALARRAIELEDQRAAFDAVVHTGPYKLGRLITKFYDRFLPFHSRRRLAFCVLLGAVGLPTLCRRLEWGSCRTPWNCRWTPPRPRPPRRKPSSTPATRWSPGSPNAASRRCAPSRSAVGSSPAGPSRSRR